MPQDYKQLGFKCGIEIHQQLEGKKLFCNCPTTIREDAPDLTIKRRFRASAGELGVSDIAAVQESSKGKHVLYEAYKDTNCLIELDEQPPNPINEDALSTALQVAKLLNCTPADNMRTMRKTIVDGSNTSGFQRTTLVGFNGFLKTKSGRVSIPTLILEEDSARAIKESSDSTTYRLDRLGIPLLEISTSTDIISPEHCKEVAEYIGLILRATGKAKRGIGTIRQDINVSIKGGARIEIKGVQDLKLIPTYVEIEVMRQKSLLEISSELKKKGIKKFAPSIIELSAVLKNSSSNLIKSTFEKNGAVSGIKIEKCTGILGREIQPNKRFGTELSQRAKVIAGVGGILHSDELPKYGITQEEVDLIKNSLSCNKEDVFVIVCDKKNAVDKALNAVIERLNESINGIPNEVRGPNEDGTTAYQRPMPGSARMYPETDIPSIIVDKKIISKINLPELLDAKSLRYQKELSLSKDLADKISKSDDFTFFEEAVKKCKKLKPSFIAEILVSYAPELARNYSVDASRIKKSHISFVFSALNKEEIAKESVISILVDIAKTGIIDLSKYKILSDKELESSLKEIAQKNKGLQLNTLIGKAMAELRGKAPGQKIVETLKKITA